MTKLELKTILQKQVFKICGDSATVENSPFMSFDYIRIIPTGKVFPQKTLRALRGAFPGDAGAITHTCGHVKWENIY